MQLKPQPNRARYIEVLQSMTPEERLLKSIELTETMRELLKTGLRDRNPKATEAELHTLYLQRLEACHNKNY